VRKRRRRRMKRGRGRRRRREMEKGELYGKGIVRVRCDRL